MPKCSKKVFPKGTKIPNHIAVVLDGNGRWARSRGLPPTCGHEAGSRAVREIINAARGWGVHTITLWGFSTENWKRPPAEVRKILSLVKKYLQTEIRVAKKEGIRFCHLGRKDRLPGDLLRLIRKAEEETKENRNHIINVALDYGGRDEILRAVKKIADDKITSRDIDEDLFSSYLDTAGQPYPNPDLFIRTSGEQRTSGLMPWQMVYSEFYFEEDHLPDMSEEKLYCAILDFSRRRRRFGAKDKVVHFKFRPEMIAKLEIKWWRLQKVPEGTRIRDYAIEHIKEQYGLSREHAIKAGKYMMEAVIFGEESKWLKARISMRRFYELIKEEVKLAFEPKIAASLQVKFWKELNGGGRIERALELEGTLKKLYAEVYRISDFQAAKIAHLRALATIERNLAEQGHGEHHWERAEDYLHKFYSALKERVA